MILKLQFSFSLIKLLLNIALVDYVLIANCSNKINAGLIPGLPIGKIIKNFAFFSNS